MLKLELVGVVRSVVLLDASSVVDVAIHVNGDFDTYSIGNFALNRSFWGLMQKTSHCKIFRAGGWAVEELTMRGYRFSHWPSFCYETLVLEMGVTIENQPGIALLLRNSHSLISLTLHFHHKEYHKIGGGQRPVYKGTWDSFDRGAIYWKTTFPRLEAIYIYGDIHSQYVLQLVQVLLRCAIGLKKLVISTKDINCPFGGHGYCYTFEQMLWLTRFYRASPRSSPEAAICFS